MTGMERVQGIGGVFFKAHDPDLLNRWYAEHLGVGSPHDRLGESVWVQESGPTVFAPFGSEHLETARISDLLVGASTSECQTSTR